MTADLLQKTLTEIRKLQNSVIVDIDVSLTCETSSNDDKIILIIRVFCFLK